MVAGQHVDKIDLLAADDLRQPLAVLVGQHVQVVVRQFITENIGPVGSAQNTDPYRGRSHNFAVELLVLFQALGVILRGIKMRRSYIRASANSIAPLRILRTIALMISIRIRSST